jgi:hypothetical protein
MTIAMVDRLNAMLSPEASPRTKIASGRKKPGATPMIIASETSVPASEERFPAGEGLRLHPINDATNAIPADTRAKTSSVVRAISNFPIISCNL